MLVSLGDILTWSILCLAIIPQIKSSRIQHSLQMSRIKAFVHKIWESLAQRNGWKVKSHSPVHWISALIIEKSKNQSNIQRGIINTVKRLNIVKSYSGISFLKHDMGILMTSSSSRPNVRHKKSSTGAIFREQPCKVNPYQSVFPPAVSNFFLLYHSKPVECKTATYLLCQYLSLLFSMNSIQWCWGASKARKW